MIRTIFTVLQIITCFIPVFFHMAPSGICEQYPVTAQGHDNKMTLCCFSYLIGLKLFLHFSHRYKAIYLNVSFLVVEYCRICLMENYWPLC